MPDNEPYGKRAFTALLVFAGTVSPAARRRIVGRAWDDYHRKHGELRPPVTDAEKAFEYDRAMRLLERLGVRGGLVYAITSLHREAASGSTQDPNPPH